MAYEGSATRPLTAQLRLKGGVESVTLTGSLTLDAADANVLNLDPGGADRTVTLLAEDSAVGALFWVRNSADATEGITINDDAAALVVALGRGDSALLGCDGSSWSVYQLIRPPRNEQLDLTGNLVLDIFDAQSLRIDPGGSARDVTVPAEATSKDLWFEIYNIADAAEALTVKDDGGSTIETVSQAEHAKFVCDGTSWLIQIPGHT